MGEVKDGDRPIECSDGKTHFGITQKCGDWLWCGGRREGFSCDESGGLEGMR